MCFLPRKKVEHGYWFCPGTGRYARKCFIHCDPGRCTEIVKLASFSAIYIIKSAMFSLSICWIWLRLIISTALALDRHFFATLTFLSNFLNNNANHKHQICSSVTNYALLAGYVPMNKAWIKCERGKWDTPAKDLFCTEASDIWMNASIGRCAWCTMTICDRLTPWEIVVYMILYWAQDSSSLLYVCD